MAKTKRVSLRLTESEYEFVKWLSNYFSCSVNEAISKMITVSQIVCNTPLVDVFKLINQMYDIGVEMDDEEKQ